MKCAEGSGERECEMWDVSNRSNYTSLYLINTSTREERAAKCDHQSFWHDDEICDRSHPWHNCICCLCNSFRVQCKYGCCYSHTSSNDTRILEANLHHSIVERGGSFNPSHKSGNDFNYYLQQPKTTQSLLTKTDVQICHYHQCREKWLKPAKTPYRASTNNNRFGPPGLSEPNPISVQSFNII